MKKILCLFAIPLIMSGAQIVINQPGQTVLGKSVIFTPIASNDTIIEIDSDNVILDLGGLVIEQGNSISSIQGIEITAGRSNITIKNGTISLVTGVGITVADNCFNVEISDINFLGCQTRAIEVNGGGTTRDCSINNCSILYSCTGASGDIGIALIDAETIRVNKCNINNSGNVSNGFSGLSLNGCQNCDFEDISIVANQGSSIIGIDVQDSVQCMFRQCFVRNNTPAIGGTFRGFDFHGIPNQFHIIMDSIISDNSSTIDCRGIYLEANSQNNFFQRCSIFGNSGGLVYGFSFTGGIANNFQNTVADCMIMNNNASGAGNLFGGIVIDGSNFGTVLRSTIAYNTSLNNTAFGLGFINSVGNNWNIGQNTVYRNIGSLTANSFGIVVRGGSTNLFTKNTAFNNGTGSATANQLAGVPGASVVARNTSNMNLVCILSNVGIPN